MSGKNLILKLYSQLDYQVWFANVKMLSTNQIAGFLNFNISKTIGDIKWIFCLYIHIFRGNIDDVILCGHGYVGVPKETIKTLRSQKQKGI